MHGLTSLEKVGLQKSVSLPVRGEILVPPSCFFPEGFGKISKSAASVGERMLGGAFLSKALVKIVHSSHISINREREEDDRV